MMTDPIADMLTRIRNACHRRNKSVTMPSSTIKVQMATILLDAGYIKNFTEKKLQVASSLKIFLKYQDDPHISAIQGLKRISKPGLRVYTQAYNVPRVLNGFGISIISTSQGMMTDSKARAANLGGEVLAYVW